MTEKELWHEYCRSFGIDEKTPYKAWCFGDDADVLAKLVCEGKKTATCSRLDLYNIEGETLPAVGDLSIVLDKGGKAVCIIKNTRVYKTKFCEVSSEHAYKEGEGERSLPYWRNVHSRFFKEEAKEYGLDFDENILLLCEEFKTVYKSSRWNF